jgi:hypothetical protein
MKASDLVSCWSAPDNSRLTAKQLSFRLPVDVAAKISALCELYPNKTRTEIIGDLLTAALVEVEKALPRHDGRKLAEDPDGEPIYEDLGPVVDFRIAADRYYKELERDMGNESARGFFSSKVGSTNIELLPDRPR